VANEIRSIQYNQTTFKYWYLTLSLLLMMNKIRIWITIIVLSGFVELFVFYCKYFF